MGGGALSLGGVLHGPQSPCLKPNRKYTEVCTRGAGVGREIQEGGGQWHKMPAPLHNPPSNPTFGNLTLRILPIMKLKASQPINPDELHQLLREKFPNDKIKQLNGFGGRKSFMISRGFWVSVGVHVKGDTVRTNETFGQSIGEMLLLMVLILLGVLIFVLVYFIGFYGKAKKFQREVDAVLKSAYSI